MIPVNRKYRILVMDDEPMVRDVASQTLRFFGFEAIVANDGESMLEIYREQMAALNPFDLVILDLSVKQGMGGDKAIALLLKLDPGARVLLSSGHLNHPMVENYADYGFAGVISKPFDLDEMQRAIVQTLKVQGLPSY